MADTRRRGRQGRQGREGHVCCLHIILHHIIVVGISKYYNHTFQVRWQYLMN
jgi:hypothetical protein